MVLAKHAAPRSARDTAPKLTPKDPMRTLMTTALALLALGPLSAAAAPAPARPRPVARAAPSPHSGFQLGAGLGLNVCVADGDADCSSLGPAASLMLAPGYRFNDHVSLSLDLQLGWLSPDADDVSATTLSVMPTVRGHFRAGRGEFVIGAGLGYSRFATSGEAWVDTGWGEDYGTLEVSWSTALALKLTAGYLFDLSPTLSLGGAIDFFLNPSTGEICAAFEGDEPCEDVSDTGDVADRLTLGLFLVNRF